MNKIENIEITKSSGNVFEDLGLEDAEEYLVKAKLAYQINCLIAKKKLTQKAAATLLGLDQPKISALSRGKLIGFSVERLFKLLATLNQDIEIIIKPHKENRKAPHRIQHIQVRYAGS